MVHLKGEPTMVATRESMEELLFFFGMYRVLRLAVGAAFVMTKVLISVVASSILLLPVMARNAFVRPATTTRVPGVALHYASSQDSDIVHIDGAFPLKGASSDSSLKKEHRINKPTISGWQRSTRKKWGVDKDYDDEYWFNKKIHSLGNTGFTGGLHAAMAPLATKMIDVFAYDGVDIRSVVAEELATNLKVNKARVLDLCCGVGMSTRALQNAFPDAKEVIGVDSSPEMVSMARVIALRDSFVQPIVDLIKALLDIVEQALYRNALDMKKAQNKAAAFLAQPTFTRSNAEHTHFPANSFDLVTIMYAFHEVPKKGRDRILREARRVLQRGGVLALIDISPDYKPSPSMLKGEPYVQEYQVSIDRQLRTTPGFTEGRSKTLIPGHVNMWLLIKRA